MFRWPGSLSAWALVAVLAGCSEPSPTRLCLDGDLGRFRLVRLAPQGKGGCQAVYRDPQGRKARVRVEPYRPGLFADAGVPAEFEKHMIYATSGDGRSRVGWFADEVAVRIEQDGAAAPGGPVLRAYLFRYPSRVVDQVQATRRDVELLRQTSRRTPGDAGVHLDLARNYRKLGNTVMAAQEYHIAVEKDPGCHPCYLEMGTLYRQLRHWDLSIRALRKAAALEPADPRAWLILGDVCWDVHNRLEAIHGYRRALQAGLPAEDRKRVEQRLAELERGKFQIEALPAARPRPDGGQ